MHESARQIVRKMYGRSEKTEANFAEATQDGARAHVKGELGMQDHNAPLPAIGSNIYAVRIAEKAGREAIACAGCQKLERG